MPRDSTGIVIVDVQKKLMAVMGRAESVAENIIRLLHLARLYRLPVILTEQYQKMLGPTLPAVKEMLPVYDPIIKMEFDCCSAENFNAAIESAGIRNIVLAGVETHICVLQTCISLLEREYTIHVPQDAVDSRTEENRHVGLDLMKRAGAVITSTETVIFQLLKRAGSQEFREMLKVIR